MNLFRLKDRNYTSQRFNEHALFLAPTRHSTYHRISGAILLLPITILLLGCNEHWRISKIFVNPQPLGGNETVFPVVLVAPQAIGVPRSHQRVVMNVVFDRDTNFTNRIGFKVHYTFYSPATIVHDSSWLDWVASSRGHAVILDCSCGRGIDAGDVVLHVDARQPGKETSLVRMVNRAEAKTWGDIEVTSKDEGSEESVTSSAAKALEISCLSESPIQ